MPCVDNDRKIEKEEIKRQNRSRGFFKSDQRIKMSFDYNLYYFF